MKIAITAASGKLGAAIAKATITLIGKNNVIGLARTLQKAKSLGIEIRPGDYNDRDILEKSLQGIDILLLVSGMDKPDKRVIQHRNVIEAAKSAGVKKIVYTSVQGAEENTSFSSIIQSNRQTEADVRDCGLNWVNGRNGLYIEPDIEYIESYKSAGGISNCAGDGKCGYTTRAELAFAYAKMLTEEKHNGQTYNLNGESITQYQLAAYLNDALGTELTYTPMTLEEFEKNRIAELGEMFGPIIAGIYHGIRDGKLNNPSHYHLAAGRPHQSWEAYFAGVKHQQ